MNRLVVVSNRVSTPSPDAVVAGGLAVGIEDALKDKGGLWFGWNGELCAGEPGDAVVEKHGDISYATIELNSQEFELYYNQFSNSSLWPVFHYLLAYFNFERSGFDGYRRTNKVFAERLAPLLRPDDVIWAHDYHLFPLARCLRDAGISNPVGLFLHIPFPSIDMLRVLPVFGQIIRDLCRYDVLGFQTEHDRRNFMEAAIDAGIEAEWVDDETLRFDDHVCHVGVYPIGIDVEGIAELAEAAMQAEEVKLLVSSLLDRALIIGVDRLDYSKGLAERFRSYERLLEKYPDNLRAVTYMQIAPRTRTGIRDYADIRHELEQASGNINGRFATTDWVPIRYLNSGLPREQLMGAFRAARVGYVAPLRDGMNLVAKEYVASQDPADPGMLVLSKLAGSANELRDAILVNPYDSEDVADGLAEALLMPLVERQRRHAAMLEVLRKHDITQWRTRFVTDLDASADRNGRNG